MKRVPLSKNEKIKSYQEYIIKDVLGTGASCIVYDAYFVDSMGNYKEVKIKECYPYSCPIERVGNALAWKDEESKVSTINKFESSYAILSQMQNKNQIKESSVYTLDIFECNNTKYIATIPTVGQTYDKCRNEDVLDIIKTILALTNAVGNFHKIGYLHMDIKPENFIVSDDNTRNGKNVALFDLDTLISLDDIKEGKIKGVSYSRNWAAPEVESKKFHALCPATDIYSIGAVLFERIMHRLPDCMDSVSYASWDFDERFSARNMNPKVKRMLSDVFHKTLCSSIKRRYQSTDELANALNDIIDVINEKNYIISSYPVNTCSFVGRKNEIDELHKGLETCGKVFVSGFGGLGKSELTKRYIKLYGENYDSISFIRYSDSLVDGLQEIRIKGAVETEDKLELLAGISSKKNLLVIDNFDVPINKDAVQQKEISQLDEILQLGFNVIVTTREDFSRVFRDFHFIKLQGLSESELFRIFENESEKILSNDEKNQLLPIIDLGKNCTFFWSLLSKLVNAGGYHISEIVETVSSGIKNLRDSEEVLVPKDRIRVEKNITEAMRELFKLYDLNEIQMEILFFIRAVSVLTLRKQNLADALNRIDRRNKPSRMNALSDLIELGLIFEADTIYMNDVLKDVIDSEFEVNCFEMELVKDFINIEFVKNHQEILDALSKNTQSAYYIEYIFACILYIFDNCKPQDEHSYEYLISLIFDMTHVNSEAIEILREIKPTRISELLNNAIEKTEDVTTKFKALMILAVINSNLLELNSCLVYDDLHVEEFKECENILNQLLFLTKSNSVDKKLTEFFYSIKINKVGIVADLIDASQNDNFTFDFSEFYDREPEQPDLTLFDDEDYIESYRKAIIDRLDKDDNTLDTDSIVKTFFSYVLSIGENFSDINYLAKKIYERCFDNVDINSIDYRSFSIFLSALLINSFAAKDNNEEKIMDKLLEMSVLFISKADDSLLRNTDAGFDNFEFWNAITQFKMYGKEISSLKYILLYTKKVEERVFECDMSPDILYDYYIEVSIAANSVSEKYDLSADETEKYKQLAKEYRIKADKVLGKVY